jgi:hypothetical protein
MKKLSKRSMLVFGSLLLVCAFAPAMASAASWTGTFPSTHVLDSPNPANRLSFSANLGGGLIAGWTCAVAQLHFDLLSRFDAVVTGTNFKACHGTGASVNCTVTPTGTGFPWTITNPTTTSLSIHRVHVSVLFENTPGAGGACGAPGTVTVTGTLNGGTWTNPGHEVEFTNATGLVSHSPTLGNNLPTTVSGTLASTDNTITMVD